MALRCVLDFHELMDTESIELEKLEMIYDWYGIIFTFRQQMKIQFLFFEKRFGLCIIMENLGLP